MKKITFYCDICGREIEEKESSRLFLRNTDLEIGYLDICPVCFMEVKDFIDNMQIAAGVEPVKLTDITIKKNEML